MSDEKGFAEIPVKIGRIQVGTAVIKEDGTFDIHITGENENGKEIYQLILAGFVYGLSIAPSLNPAVDGKLYTRLEHERPITEVGGFRPNKPESQRVVNFSDIRNVQFGHGNTQHNFYD